MISSERGWKQRSGSITNEKTELLGYDVLVEKDDPANGDVVILRVFADGHFPRSKKRRTGRSRKPSPNSPKPTRWNTTPCSPRSEGPVPRRLRRLPQSPVLGWRHPQPVEPGDQQGQDSALYRARRRKRDLLSGDEVFGAGEEVMPTILSSSPVLPAHSFFRDRIPDGKGVADAARIGRSPRAV